MSELKRLASVTLIACAITFTVIGSMNSTHVVAQASTTTLVYKAPFIVSPSAQSDIQACVGEPVSFSGTWLILIHETDLANGAIRFVFHRNTQGPDGRGVLTGTTYHVGGHLQDVEIITASG